MPLNIFIILYFGIKVNILCCFLKNILTARLFTSNINL
nr:MAG TPA: hypothetical protein [Caudoviricetes sp.]